MNKNERLLRFTSDEVRVLAHVLRETYERLTAMGCDQYGPLPIEQVKKLLDALKREA